VDHGAAREVNAPYRYFGRRLGHLLVVWLGISFIAFSLSNLAPGDPAEMILLRQTGEAPTREAVERLREQLGLDAPFPARYGRWLAHAVRGDLGASYASGAPVARELSERFGATLQLAIAAIFVSLIVAIPLGVLSAVHRDSPLDHGLRVGALIGASVPGFWLSYLLILLFAVGLGLLPAAGQGDWRNLVLPAVALGLGDAASLMRLTRASMLEELREDYVRTARAKGLPARLIVVRHALRNALNPIVTLSSLHLGRLLGQAAIVETVFGWPGIGKLAVDSIYARDYPAIQGFVLYMGTVFVVVNFVVDMAYVRMDPRVSVFRSWDGRRA